MPPLDTSNLWSVRDVRDSFTDVIIRCKDNQALKAHKIILSAASKRLFELCTNNDEINMTDISIEPIEYLLELIYADQSPKVDFERRQEVEDLAKLWGVKAARDPETTNDHIVDQSPESKEPPAATSTMDLEEMPLKGKPDLPVELPKEDPVEEKPSASGGDNLPEPELADDGGRTTSITSIPDEVLVKILSYQSTRSLLNWLPNVSSQFSRVCHDSGAHISVDLDNCYMNTDMIIRFLKGKRHIEAIKMEIPINSTDQNKISSIFDMAIMNQKKTRTVTFSTQGWAPLFFHKLSDNPWKAEQIRHLDIQCSRVVPPTRIPTMKNLVRLRLHFVETRFDAADQLEFIGMLSSYCEKLEALELHHEDKVDDDWVTTLIGTHGRTLKSLECPRWKMSPHFASNHLVPGSCFRDLEKLALDASHLPTEVLVQIALLPKLKKLTVNSLYELTEALLVQMMSNVDFNTMESFTFNGNWNSEFSYLGEFISSASLSHRTSFKADKGRSNFSDLSQVLSLPCMDHLESVQLNGCRLEDFGILKRFENLKNVSVLSADLSPVNLRQLVELAEERPSLKAINADGRHANATDLNRANLPMGCALFLSGNNCLDLTTGSSKDVEAEVVAILGGLANLASSPRYEEIQIIQITSACAVADSVIALASKTTNLRELEVKLEEFSAAEVVAMLQLAVARKLRLLKLSAKESFWQLTNLECFTIDLGLGSLVPDDLRQMLACLKTLNLPNLELSFGGIYQDELTDLINEVNSLEYLALRNTNLVSVPYFRNPNLETLKIGGRWSSGKTAMDEGVRRLYDRTGIVDSPKGRINFLTKDNLARIMALPKLKYFQMCPMTACCSVSSGRFSSRTGQYCYQEIYFS